MRRSDCCKLIPRKIKIYKQQLFKIVRIGLPAGLQSSLFSLANSVIQSSVNSFGEIFMAGNAAAANIESYVYLSINAFSQASVNFVGQNFGAKQFKRIWRITVTCLACVLVVGVTLGQLANLFGTELLMLFLPNSSEGVTYGLLRVGIVCTTYFLCGLMDVVTGSLRGMGASVVPTIVSLVCICGLRIGWIATIFQIPQYHTPEILYTCYPLSWIATFIIEFAIFLFFYSKYAKILNYRDKFSRRV